MLTVLLVYAYFWCNSELYSVGLCAGDSASSCQSQGDGGRHLRKLALELLRRHDHAHATEQLGVEGLSHLHVSQLCLRAAGGEYRFAFSRWLSAGDCANDSSTSATRKRLTSH